MNKMKMVKNMLVMGIVILGLNVFAQAQSTKMKSLMVEVQKQAPYHENIIADKCDNAKVTYIFDVESFGDDADALQRVPSMGLKQTSSGILRFCHYTENNIGIDAIKSKVKFVKLKNITDKAGKKITLLKDGTLLVEMAFHYYDAGFSDVQIQKILGEIL